MRYVAALDIGTTTIQFHILNEKAVTVASSTEKVNLIYPQPGFVEIDPNQLWQIIIKVIKDTLDHSGIDPKNIACIGISSQRSSFVTWNLKTGKYYHRFITWKDQRAATLVKEWNQSIMMRGLRMCAGILYTFTRRKRFLAGSMLKFMNTQVTLKLVWALQNILDLREAVSNEEVAFGSVDCWLLYKLTGKHIMDVSSASATGIFDPFTMEWANWALSILKLPRNIFPEVVDTAGYFGVIPEDIFGAEIPIYCSMADQAASLFGSGCFKPGDLKITMGTGTFMNVNTGREPHASITGLYPVVGWRIGKELVYVVEGSSSDTGILIEWAKTIGIIDNISETSDAANSVNDTDGVYFVPAFSGLQAPINDYTAATGFFGLKPTTKKKHIIRSLLESLIFRIQLLYECLCKETSFTYRRIKVDGGVTKNDFVMQSLADSTGLEVERPVSVEMSILGVAFLAGLKCGIWKNREELLELRQTDKIFKPNEESQLYYQYAMRQWKRAVERFKNWY
ncbi:Putative glycerol kinase 5 [Trachymyrmex zeteki]|uniref:Glycerol kinase 5 n=1 Tax=Mycetomoellerius zeteki TaxID=64791 RepID=A0A151XK53_9HYME|nr:PREDICTED: putative glycerol kinase 5 [Trachymyrmex zeteki]XP_018318102.1 PREDICTED: putative glycerol kinase 5 [Trachymyrmex zeteki]KYQ60711.1 Putative glycerol kinase 5 [Trachymyrmex zeteki]